MDVKSAYLNVPLDYEIYVEPLEGFKRLEWELCWETLKNPSIG